MLKPIKLLLNLIWPNTCLNCDNLLKLNELPHICPACQQLLSKHKLVNPVFPYGYSIYQYDGLVRKLIHLFKYKRKQKVAQIFIKTMADLSQSHLALEKFDLIIPIPISWFRYLKREFNQAQVLASLLSNLNIPLLSNALVRIKLTLPQSDLNRKERIKNIKGSFQVKEAWLKDIKDKKILLIDDLITTGATLNEARKTLLASGAKEVKALTLAKEL